MLKILSVNLNVYDDCVEVIPAELEKCDCDFYLFCGALSLYNQILPLVKKPRVYLGVCPLTNDEMGGICALVAYVFNKNIDFELHFFEEKTARISTHNNELSSLLIGYIGSKENYSSIYFLRKLLIASPPKSLLLISLLKDIKPYLDYDNLLNMLFTTEIGSCLSKDMSENLLLAIKNKTFHNVITGLPINDFSKPLKKLFNDYIIFRTSKDETALLLYSAIFINLATFSKHRGDISISYLYLQRSVEITLIYYFLKRNSIYFDHNNKLCFSADSTPVKGVGPLLHLFFQNNTTIYAKKIWGLNTLRNRSVIGHGIYMPCKSQFNDLYLAVEGILTDLILNSNDKDFFDRGRSCLKMTAKMEILSKIKTRLAI